MKKILAILSLVIPAAAFAASSSGAGKADEVYEFSTAETAVTIGSRLAVNIFEKFNGKGPAQVVACQSNDGLTVLISAASMGNATYATVQQIGERYRVSLGGNPAAVGAHCVSLDAEQLTQALRAG